MYKIATWNVERPKKGTEKTALVMEKIKEINADILVLTESAVSMSLAELYPFSVHSLAYERTPEEHWVSIFSKWKITKQIETFDNFRTACAVVETPFGKNNSIWNYYSLSSSRSIGGKIWVPGLQTMGIS